MALAPLHPKSFRLLFVRNPRTEWPRYGAAERGARLSTRARRERRRQIGRLVLVSTVVATLVVAALASVLWLIALRG